MFLRKIGHIPWLVFICALAATSILINVRFYQELSCDCANSSDKQEHAQFQEKPWHLQDTTWTSHSDQLKEAYKTLKGIDISIQQLESISAKDINYHKASDYHYAKAKYYEARVQLLYHIYNLSSIVEAEVYNDETE